MSDFSIPISPDRSEERKTEARRNLACSISQWNAAVQERNSSIADARWDGLSWPEISEAYGIAESTARRYARQAWEQWNAEGYHPGDPQWDEPIHVIIQDPSEGQR